MLAPEFASWIYQLSSRLILDNVSYSEGRRRPAPQSSIASEYSQTAKAPHSVGRSPSLQAILYLARVHRLAYAPQRSNRSASEKVLRRHWEAALGAEVCFFPVAGQVVETESDVAQRGQDLGHPPVRYLGTILAIGDVPTVMTPLSMASQCWAMTIIFHFGQRWGLHQRNNGVLLSGGADHADAVTSAPEERSGLN